MKGLTKLGMLLLTVCLSLTLAACGSDSNDSPAPDTAVEGNAFDGGLVWDNWTTEDAGGSGELPAEVVNKDFVRCKACHGWDAKGKNGGYVRRTAKDTRPNPEPGVDLTAADAMLTLDAVFNSSGRAFSEANQQMPAYDSADGLSEQQAADVREYLLNGPKIGDFANIDTTADPVAYTFTNADMANGETLYGTQCQGCHGAAAATNQTASAPPLGAYYVRDGKYSEGFHKSVYGIPGTSMTRAAMGELSGQQVADIHAYIQSRLELPGDVFAGGLAWDNWTTTAAGGSGELPAEVVNKDFVRCKACHGWDAKGKNGGYVRRTAKDTRPNPEPGVDLTAADATLTLAAIDNTDGRAFSVEDQTMPAFNTAEGLTVDQADNLLKFLVSGPKIGDFADIDTSADPVAYTFNDVDMANGEALYGNQCQGCHGAADATEQTAVGPELGTYYVRDGKYSEGFHKTVYGIPGTIMTRAAMGELSGQQVADIHAYIQSKLELPDVELTADVFAGGLAWDNWTTTDAGGTGSLPTGAVNKDFVRCKACHGWDAKGKNGGYVRRTANDTRPNPEPGVDLTAADATLTLAAIDNTTGRAFSVEDQTMPAYDTAEGLSEQQAVNLQEFLLTGPKVGDFADIDTSADPVAYTFNNVDTVTGQTLYGSQCQGCHGAADATEQTAVGPALGPYYVRDGKYSEGFHKTTYGIPGTIMTRSAMGELSGQQVADIHAYIQETLNGGSTPDPDPTPVAPTSVVYPNSMGDVNFNHTNHSSALVCTECHTTTPPEKIVISKDVAHNDLCRPCHVSLGVSDSCGTCHGN